MSPTKINDDYERAVEDLSDALAALQRIDAKSPKPSREMVDALARLNAQSNSLDKVIRGLKDIIKSDLLESGDTIRQGNTFQAVLRSVPKTCLDMDRIKTFLGKQVLKFSFERVDNVLSFEPKT